MPPNLADYESAATAIYQPQQQAEQIALQATDQTTKNSLEAEKGDVSTTYQSAIDQLTQSVQDQTGQINQLYSQRLGGNFSGLQGNDLGQMFSRANEQQGIIEQTRANKLNEITTGETNADIDYNAGVAALTPKYQSLETQYAQSAYGSAASAYNTQQNEDRNYALNVAKFNLSAQNSSNSSANQYKVTGKPGENASGTGTADSTSNGYEFTGPNGQPISLAEYINGSGKNVNDILDLLQNGSSYDRQIYRQVQANGLSRNPQDILNQIAEEDSKNYYGLR